MREIIKTMKLNTRHGNQIYKRIVRLLTNRYPIST